jgi:DNA-binding response OmpR family regulator
MTDKPCLIVADDSRTIRDQLDFFLKMPDIEIEVLLAHDGLEALALFDANKGRVKLVLTDIHMPRLEGLDLVRILRDERKYTGPIIVLTQEGSNSMIRKAKDMGVNGWMVKPFNGKDLQRTVEQILKAAKDKDWSLKSG